MISTGATYPPPTRSFLGEGDGRRRGLARRRLLLIGRICLICLFGPIASRSGAQEATPAPTDDQPRLKIHEYRVKGARRLPPLAVERAVYPYLGPGRTTEDVEKARAALEQAYKDAGYQTVLVEIPPQQVKRGVVTLQVVETTVGRLRVKGARYFSLDRIKEGVPSLAEGQVVDFNAVTREIIALNQHPDRRVSPEMKPGFEPGTVDVDLHVKDTLPLHGSLEFNNRYSADTTELRLNGSISYGNLWQRGHTAGFSFQVAPENHDDALVYSAYYLARFASLPRLMVMLQGTKQDSNVSTLGGAAVAGRGEVIGLRAMLTLPEGKSFFHNLSAGVDYKHFDENVSFGSIETRSPITYFPISLNYGATWIGKQSLTELNAGAVFSTRGAGTKRTEFEAKRYRADDGFFVFKGDLAHTHDLPGGFQLYGKVQGQLASKPLINNEQFSGGGLNVTRGYLESEALGDNALFGTLEFRSPPLFGKTKQDGESGASRNEWRVYAFVDAGRLTLNDPLPEQEDVLEMASFGFGSRFKLFKHYNASLDAGFPLIDQAHSKAEDWRLTFRLWADF